MRLGIDTLLDTRLDELRGRRLGLIAHAASVDSAGRPSAGRLHEQPGVKLAALFGPEHGWTGQAAAGDKVGHGEHPAWRIPIHSLYGETRRPTPAMLGQVDVLIFDLANLAVRCYTYISTLRHVLEAAAEERKRVIVADRPVPAADLIDGPLLDPAFESFVGFIPTSFCYGMTTGETALFLREALSLDVDLEIAAMTGYDRSPPPAGTAWHPPSPGIRTRATALAYPLTVCCEALPALDYGRGHPDIFRVMAAPWIDPHAAAAALNHENRAGLLFEPVAYQARAGLHEGHEVFGVRITVTDETAYRPVAATIGLLHYLAQTYGQEKLWDAPGTRPAFLDKLYGTDKIRGAIQTGTLPPRSDPARFLQLRRKCLLYAAP